ncbi:esterase/lipase family protein [Streptomyces sp. NPDC091387]|uniref:esterase/lipase family protein n=1 Tax=Streptomyces sp. NPDC091387 TaxID=3365998 RepID=UPI00380D20A1
MTSRSPVDDLVVVVPGILGSRLADADGNEVWGLSGPALLRGIRTFGRSVKGLALPPDLGDEHPGDGVSPLGPMRDLHGLLGIGTLVDGYDSLLDWLERHFTLRRRRVTDEADAPANLIAFAYDWRLSCRYNAGRLAGRVEEELGRWRASAPERAGARVVFVCHSMGGLVARHYVERGGGAETTRRVITLGTPYRGSLDALLYLVNGVGPAGIGLTAFARSLPSLHQLVPDYAALITAPGEPLRYAREVTGLPGADAALLQDAARFHEALRESGAGAAYGVEYLPVSGVRQPTPTTAEVRGERLTGLLTINGTDEGGDGRVPRLSSAPVGVAGRPAYTPWEKHGSLQNNTALRQGLHGWLIPDAPVHRGPEAPDAPLVVDAPDVITSGEVYELRATVPPHIPGHDRAAVLVAAGGGPVRTSANLGGGRYVARLAGLPAGPHRVRVSTGNAGHVVMTALVLVVEGGAGDGA